jgi:hypothetical protein
MLYKRQSGGISEGKGNEGYIMVIITIKGAVYRYIFISIGNIIKMRHFWSTEKKEQFFLKKTPNNKQVQSCSIK